MRKILACLLVLLMGAGMTACGGDTTSDGTEAAGTVYYLNFKPEIADVYDRVAKAYKKETGVTLKVVTAASGTYEQTLKSEMAKSAPPTLFQINGPKGYANWKEYCADLKETTLYQHLTDPGLAVTVGDGVYGIPYVVEGYGILYNQAIMDRYFALPDRTAAIGSMDEITGFDALKAVVEDMTAHKDALGIKGVFACTSLKSGEDWRWQTHLANVPLTYEFIDGDIDLSGDGTNEITFRYGDRFRALFDLYLQNSTTAPGLLGSREVADSMAEFALGQCAMVQNGNWAWGDMQGVSGNTVKEEDIRFLPVYIGVEGEETQGLCVGTENFFAINAKASDTDRQLAADFVYWLFSSPTGKRFVTEEMGFIAPFDTFTDEERPQDPLAKEVLRWIDKEGVHSLPWNFTVFPSLTFKNNFGAALLQYAQGNKTWDEVTRTVIDGWKAESAAR